MMLRGTGQPVALIDGSRRASGEVRIARWDKRARLLRAAKAWATLWVLAVLSVLLPVAHFVLVPGFLIAGPIVAFKRLRQESGVLGGEGTCPSCGKGMSIDVHADEWPLYAICQGCRASARVEKLDVSPAL